MDFKRKSRTSEAVVFGGSGGAVGGADGGAGGGAGAEAGVAKRWADLRGLAAVVL